jgi:hypothetical protein
MMLTVSAQQPSIAHLLTMIAAMHNPSDSLVPTYTLSSNPPNPKTSFRTNDWM